MINKYLTLLFFTLLTIVGCIACSDLNSYSTHPDHRLSFSHDTLKLDTILTEVKTSTHILKVYNRNKKPLLISSIYLANPHHSGFRMNVDGVKGNNLKDIEIRERDSLFIFVEAIISPNEIDRPVLKRDSIVFITNGVMQDIKLEAYGQDHLRWHGKVITENTIIESRLPIVIYDSLYIEENATLTLKAGACLFFHGKAEMKIKGNILAKGNLNEPICFRGDRTDKLFPYLPYDHLPNQWGGLHFYESSNDNHLEYVDIHGGEYGILCESSKREKTQITITNSIIHQVKTDALKLINSAAVIANTQISNAGNHCVYLLGGNYEFIHCTIANYFNWDTKKGVALHFRNELENEVYPLSWASFNNCIIAGSTKDELSGVKSPNDNIDFNYLFNSCLINSSSIENDRVTNVIWSKDDSFVTIDKKTQTFNYQLESPSEAIGIAHYETAKKYPLDRLGRSRLSDGKPDAGCYEWSIQKE